MTDPTVRDWREMTKVHNHGPDEGAGIGCPEVVLADGSLRGACLDSPHRYTYPADAGDVPAGTRFDRPYLSRPDGTLVDNDINMPSHYTHLPVEAIDITEHFNFNMGNALKYIWRADFKGDPIKDLKKAAWYINREITRRERGA